MKLHYPTTTAAIAAAALPALVTSYNMGGYMFGRPFVVTPKSGSCSPPSSFKQQQRDWVDNAFDDLESEMNGGFPGNSAKRRRRRGSGRVDFESDKEEDESVREKRAEAFRQQQKQQKEMFNQALNLANDVVTGLARDAASTLPNDSESLKQQKQWLNRAFGIASDAALGRSSPRFEVNNSDDKFQISLDVPGVKLSDIDIRVVDDEERGGNSNAKNLVIQGKRQGGLGGEQKPVEFKKEFSFDASIIDTGTIAAQLNNGVLLVSASKIPKKEPAEKKIQVIQIAEDNNTSEETSSEIGDGSSSKKVELTSNDEEASKEENEENEDEEKESESN